MSLQKTVSILRPSAEMEIRLVLSNNDTDKSSQKHCKFDYFKI